MAFRAAVGRPGRFVNGPDGGHCRCLTLVAEKHVAFVSDEGFILPDRLGDYVSELVLKMPQRPPLHLINVHACPRPVTFDETPCEQWRRPSEARVYYSDVVSCELVARAAAGKHVVAAGDFNEAHEWDVRHNTRSSHEFLSRLESAGFADVTRGAWASEVTTQTKHPHQVDRIFASTQTSIAVDAAELSLDADDGLTDHLPITFTVVPLGQTHTGQRRRTTDGASRFTVGAALTGAPLEALHLACHRTADRSASPA
jgi:hypothetical protein